MLFDQFSDKYNLDAFCRRDWIGRYIIGKHGLFVPCPYRHCEIRIKYCNGHKKYVSVYRSSHSHGPLQPVTGARAALCATRGVLEFSRTSRALAGAQGYSALRLLRRRTTAKTSPQDAGTICSTSYQIINTPTLRFFICLIVRFIFTVSSKITFRSRSNHNVQCRN